MQDPGSRFDYGGSPPDGDEDADHHGYVGHHGPKDPPRPGRRRAADAPLPPPDTGIPETPTRAVRPRAQERDASIGASATGAPPTDASPSVPRAAPPGPEPRDTPPPGAEPWNAPPAGTEPRDIPPGPVPPAPASRGGPEAGGRLPREDEPSDTPPWEAPPWEAPPWREAREHAASAAVRPPAAPSADEPPPAWDPAEEPTRQPAGPSPRQSAGSPGHGADGAERVHRARQVPEPGLPGWAAIVVSLLCTSATILADLALTGDIGVLFGLCFVFTGFGVAAGVRRSAMFTAGVLPPLSALAAFVALGVAVPEKLVGGDVSGLAGTGQAVLAGLAASAWFLVAACSVCLGTLALRSSRRPPGTGRPGRAG